MNEEVFNIQIRKFLKKVGIGSQREIEKSVRAALEDGRLSGAEPVAAKMTLELPGLGVTLEIEDRIELE